MDLGCFHVLRCFAFSSFSGTVVEKYMIFPVVALAPNIEKHRSDWPFEIQWAPEWHTKSAKWRQQSSIAKKAVRLFCVPEADLVLGSISDVSWAPFW